MSDFLYCLNSSTIKPTPLLDKIEIAGETGYSAIELWHEDIDAHLAQGGSLEDIRKAVADQGLTVPTTIHLKGWWDAEGREHTRVRDECKRKLEQAAAVGARHTIAGPPHGPADYELGARRYRDLLELGLQFGVRPAVEYLGFVRDVTTIEDAMRIMEGSGHPEASVVLDPFHCFRGGGPIESIRKLSGEQVAISHFNDAPETVPRDQQRDPDRVLPGEGCIDLKTYLALLREIGYDRWLSLELFREDLWNRAPRDVARLGLEAMRTVVEE